MKRFKEYLLERKQVGTIYHYTTIKNFPDILITNKLKSIYKQVSFTRDKNFHKTERSVGTEIRFTIDGDKLSDKYKINPYHDKYLDFEDYDRDEKEEIIKGEVKDIMKYVKSIEIIDPKKIDYTGRTFHLKYKIPVVVDFVTTKMFMDEISRKYKVKMSVLK